MKSENLFIQRTFYWSSRQLIASITVPTPRNRRSGWHCWLDVKLEPGRRVHHERIVGVDGWASVDQAMDAARRFIEERFPDASAFAPGGGTFFPFVVHPELPDEYFRKLRAHLERESARMTKQLFKEFRKNRDAGKHDDLFRRMPLRKNSAKR